MLSAILTVLSALVGKNICYVKNLDLCSTDMKSELNYDIVTVDIETPLVSCFGREFQNKWQKFKGGLNYLLFKNTLEL